MAFGHKPTYMILDEVNKLLIGPFMEDEGESAEDYIARHRMWPFPRIVQGQVAYGLTSDAWSNSLPGWRRIIPDLPKRRIRRPNR